MDPVRPCAVAFSLFRRHLELWKVLSTLYGLLDKNRDNRHLLSSLLVVAFISIPHRVQLSL